MLKVILSVFKTQCVLIRTNTLDKTAFSRDHYKHILSAVHSTGMGKIFKIGSMTKKNFFREASSAI